MDPNALRVFNAMYSLGLSDKEMDSVDKEYNSDATGICNMYKKGDYLIYVSHDEKKSDIHIKKTDREVLVPSRILCKVLFQLDKVPKQIYALHTLNRYRSNDWKHKTTARTLKELKSRIIDRLSDDWDKLLTTIEQWKALFWLMDEKYEPIVKDTRPNFNTIIKVFQLHNKRVAIFKEEKYWETRIWNRQKEHDELYFHVKSFKPSDAMYNYVDEGREIFDNIWIATELCNKISEEEMELIQKRYERHEEVYLDEKEYANICNTIRLEMLSARRRENERELKDKMDMKVSKQFEKGTVKRQGLEISKEFIKYNGLQIKGPKLRDFIFYNNVLTSRLLDFNSLVTSYIDYVLERTINRNYNGDYSSPDIELKGDVKDIVIGKVKMSIHIDNKGVCYIITDVRNRIRKDEIHTVMASALQYETQKDYNAFLREVSNKSLRVIDALKYGLSFVIQASPSEDNDLVDESMSVHINLKVERERNKNYVILPGKKLKIKSTEHFFKLNEQLDKQRWDYNPLQRTIKLLYQAIEDIEANDISMIIENGKKEYNLKVKRSKEFIEHAKKLTKAEEVPQGWVVKGVSGTEYLIEKSLRVYTWVNDKPDRYICIVDVGSERDEAGINDCIAKRMLALSKDKFIAKEVYTLGDKTDGFWAEV